jgi:hypothetical protein
LARSVVQKTKTRCGGGSSISFSSASCGVGELVRLGGGCRPCSALGRLQHDALADLADIVDAALRRGVHLDDVEGAAVRDRDAGVTCLVRVRGRAFLTVEPLGEDARERRLAGAARAGEKIGLPYLSGADRVLQRPHDRLLPDDLVEVQRAVLPVERGHASIQAR